MTENITLVQLMDALGDVNRAVIIFGYYTFDSNYKNAFLLTLDSLNLI